MSNDSSRLQTLTVDGQGFVFVDGVKVARCVKRKGELRLQFCDKDRRRSAQRGTRYVEVAVRDLARAVGDGSGDTGPLHPVTGVTRMTDSGQ